MFMTRIPLPASLLCAVLMLAGCFPPPEQAGELARTSMQKYFRTHPEYKDQAIEVVSVRVTGSEDKKVDAIATIVQAGRTFEVPVVIVIDGVNLEWFADPTALTFLARPKPGTAQQIPR
ncbi:MAG: hypothetical protein JNK99_00475 [Candidatus Accumulibacter sp.]|uniref:hypothetical protein n=1 Tax=Accumulibacter sp. TaxID=2053492 RepID=UPI001A5EBFF4|nr:hypothetical protein [Accumulibacter sp.]MBL8393212.1 hypothetical protein [Accumulibacter sp.]